MAGYVCPKCGRVIDGSVNTLMAHQKNVHALIFGDSFTNPLTCSQDGCKRTFRYRNTLKRHMEKNHQPIHGEKPIDNNMDDINYNDDNSSINGNDDDDNMNNDDQLWDNFTQENLTKMVATTIIARMRASSSIVQVTANMIIDE